MKNHVKKDSVTSEFITFMPFGKEHFVLVQHWINAPHVAPWWAEGVVWNAKNIEKKYGTYTDSYKIVDGQKKPIYAYIIGYRSVPIGYIQYYNIYDFPDEQIATLQNLPKNLAAIDLYIGDVSCIGKGLGVKIINQFLESIVFKKFDACFVDPSCKNVAAIKAYKKVGFQIVNQIDNKVYWMIKYKKQ